MAGPIYFAIGDIHGEARKLGELHEAILERIAFERRAATIVHLGDYVDRGPNSKAVIERVMALEKRFDRDPAIEVVSLMGNHEQMMLDAYDADENGGWWTQGGMETADSYQGPGLGDEQWRKAVPKEHIDWLRKRPGLLYDEARRLAFVHAGIEPAIFPNCTDEVRLWTRSDRFFEKRQWPERDELKDLLVIHGHTPKSYDPEVFPHRINVDTGAVFGGPLTAVMLKEGNDPEFLRAS